MSSFSFNSNTSKENNSVHIIQFEKVADAGLQVEFNFERIESNVDFRTGYLDKIDIQATELRTAYAWRFNRGQLKRFSLDLTGTLNQDTRGNTTGYSGSLLYWTEFLAQFYLHGYFSVGKSKYQVFNDVVDTDDDRDLVWTEDFIPTYGGDFFDFRWVRGGFFKGASVELGWEKRGIYNEEFTEVEPGTQLRTELELTLRPLSNFEWSFTSNWIRQTLDRTGERTFDGVTYATALHYQITRSLFLTTRLLGETRDNQYNFDFLIGYYFGAGNIIQLSYKKNARTEDFVREGGHTITLKISYLFRL
jgi:hypothetical protein